MSDKYLIKKLKFEMTFLELTNFFTKIKLKIKQITIDKFLEINSINKKSVIGKMS